MSAYGERIAGMEVEVRELKKAFYDHKSETTASMNELKDKLDELLVLRNKGAGVVWLVSTLVGTGILGAVLQLLQWIRS
jgi:hypothetical protein